MKIRAKSKKWLAEALQVANELKLKPENFDDFLKYVKSRRSLKREAKDEEEDLSTIISRMGLVTGMGPEANRRMLNSMRDLGLIVVDEDLVRHAFKSLKRRRKRPKYLSPANDNQVTKGNQ